MPSDCTHCFTTRITVRRMFSSGDDSSRTRMYITSSMYRLARVTSISGMMYPTARRYASSAAPRAVFTVVHSGFSTQSNDSMPYGYEASARSASARAVTIRTRSCSSLSPFLMQSTRWPSCGSTAQPISCAICATIRTPVWRASQLFLLLQTAQRKGRSGGMPSAEATTEKARAVTVRTLLSALSRSLRSVEIMKERPAALARLLLTSRPSTRANLSSSMSMGSTTTRILCT